MKKIVSSLLLLLAIFTVASCNKPKKLAAPTEVSITSTGLISWTAVEHATSYVVTINSTETEVSTTSYQVKDLTVSFTYSVYAKADKYENSDASAVQTFSVKPIPTPTPTEVKVAIDGSSELYSSHEMTLKATVTGSDNQAVTWSIKSGSDSASITDTGKLTAKEVTGDKIIEVIATSVADTTAYASKIITIVAKPELTQAMLDDLNDDRVGFEGYVNISLYEVGLFEKLYDTYTSIIKTAMDGTNWYAEYLNSSTNITQGIYYSNHNGLACQVGLSLMNDEKYVPMEDSDGKSISWEDSGMYNNLKNLKVSDFKFNDSTWRYEYCGSDNTLTKKVVASANPYEFVPDGEFSLIIEEGLVMGISSKSQADYSVQAGYKAIQELTVLANLGDTVTVPTISKYSHESIHDDLAKAIQNMQSLTSYKMDYSDIQQGLGATSYLLTGYEETINEKNAFYKPYTYEFKSSITDKVKTYTENGNYGYQKISDNLYNSYFQNDDGTYSSSRAYESDFNNAKPTFGFAAELFRTYYEDKENGTTTYYVDELMNNVASTFYYGVGNDANLYGIFAAKGRTSETSSFTPYVVVKDGYIIESCFYYYLGYLSGVTTINYSDFNTAKIENEEKITFTTRQVPTSWKDLTVQVSKDLTSTSEDVEKNAQEYLLEFLSEDNFNNLPFFGAVLGDTYGFGLTTYHLPGGSHDNQMSVVFYYDVPLDIDYSITSSIKMVEDYLISLGFTKNQYGEYKKGSLIVSPVDSSLDLNIYVWIDKTVSK